MFRKRYKVVYKSAWTGRRFHHVYVKPWYSPFWWWKSLHSTLGDAESEIAVLKAEPRYY